MVSEIGLLLALAGAGWLLLSPARPKGSGAPLALMLTMATLVLYNRQIIPDLLWAYRRFAVFAVPVSAVLAAVAVARLGRWGTTRMRHEGLAAGRGLPLLALVAALGGAAAVSAREASLVSRYGNVRDLEGATALIERLGATIERRAVVIFEPRTRRGLLRLEGVLQHELGIDVLVERLRSLAGC